MLSGWRKRDAENYWRGRLSAEVQTQSLHDVSSKMVAFGMTSLASVSCGVVRVIGKLYESSTPHLANIFPSLFTQGH